jgi:SAM-dependent methyltransferase
MQNVSENKEWFKTWFDSPYYHQLYKDRNDKEAQQFLRNLIAKLNPPKNAKILDLACGRGRHSRYLNSLGYDVSGADLSQASINWAKQFENKNLHFLVHDMRNVIPGARYNCIFNLFTSFGYFTDKKENLSVLTSVHEMLKNDGCFVIDFLNVFKICSTLKEKETKTVEGLDFSIKRKVENGMIIKKISFTDRGSNFKFSEQVQAFTKNDFDEMLDQSGFKIIAVYGNYAMNDFNENTSDRLILICKKKST